jgi:hypothetical protein
MQLSPRAGDRAEGREVQADGSDDSGEQQSGRPTWPGLGVGGPREAPSMVPGSSAWQFAHGVIPQRLGEERRTRQRRVRFQGHDDDDDDDDGGGGGGGGRSGSAGDRGSEGGSDKSGGPAAAAAAAAERSARGWHAWLRRTSATGTARPPRPPWSLWRRPRASDAGTEMTPPSRPSRESGDGIVPGIGAGSLAHPGDMAVAAGRPVAGSDRRAAAPGAEAAAAARPETALALVSALFYQVSAMDEAGRQQLQSLLQVRPALTGPSTAPHTAAAAQPTVLAESPPLGSSTAWSWWATGSGARARRRDTDTSSRQ